MYINTENSKLVLTACTHKQCYGMKGQTDNAEHINLFSILFLWLLNDAWEAIFIFRNVGEPGEYAVFKRGMLYNREKGTNSNSHLKRQIQNYKLSFLFGFFYVAYA